jgi:hypothetical protein
MGSQVRKSKRQLQSELTGIWLQMLCGVLPHTIMKENKLTERQFNSYLKQLKREAGKRFKQQDGDFLALQSELYIQNMIKLRANCDIMIARACVDKEQEEIVEPEFIRLARDINNDIINHQASMVNAQINFKMAEMMKKVKENEDKGTDINKVTSDTKHTGIS